MNPGSQAAAGGGVIALGAVAMLMGFVLILLDVDSTVNALCCGVGILLLFVGILMAAMAAKRKQHASPPPPKLTFPPPTMTVLPPPERVPFCPKCGSATWWNSVEMRWNCTACGHILPAHVPPPGSH